ncbi:hypothetical protein [Elizabethkingia phage TCUEAP3]|nr:hypothetical protein [Elizabethkingia phage TCUEAP3]
MILSFKTQINGKPTLFPEKIFAGLLKNGIVPTSKDFFKCYRIPPMLMEKLKPKIHTIREDNTNRWKPGIMIDFFIGTRTKNMFRFAPRVPVVSKQRIFMTYLPQCGQGFEVSLDGRYLYKDEIEKIAINDGFDTVDDFEEYFISQMKEDQFSGKIIHWTNFKY